MLLKFIVANLLNETIVILPLIVWMCLVGWWAAISRHHWAMRATIVLVFTSAILPTRSADLIALVLIHSTVVACAFTAMRWLRGKTQRDELAGGRSEVERTSTGRTGMLALIAGCCLSGLVWLGTDSSRYTTIDLVKITSGVGLAIAVCAVATMGIFELASTLVSQRTPRSTPQTRTRRWLNSFQFRLKDLLLIAAFTGALTTIVSHGGNHDLLLPLLYTALAALATASISLFAAWLVFAHRPVWVKFITLLVGSWGIHFVALALHQLHIRFPTPPRFEFFSSFRLLALLAILLLILGLVRGARLGASTKLGVAARIGCRLALLVVLVVLSTLNLRLYAFMWRPPPGSTEEITDSKTHETLRRITGELAAKTQTGVLNASAQQALLHQARVAISRPFHIPSQFATWDESFRDLIMIRQLARSFESESIAAMSADNFVPAAAWALDCMRLGQNTGTVGRLVHWQEGNWTYLLGIAQLRQTHHSLSRTECVEILENLIELESARTSVADVVNQAKRAELHVDPWMDWLIGYDLLSDRSTVRMICPRIPQQVPDWCVMSDRWRSAKFRLMCTELALRAYRLQTGEYPSSLADLVPSYLPEIPLDPYAPEIPLRYRSTNTGYDCYSVGPDGTDDGGKRVPTKPLEYHLVEGDFFLDSEDFTSAGEAES